MRQLLCIILWFGFLGPLANPVFSDDLLLNDGSVIKGEPVSFNDQGVVVRTSSGSYSERVNWTKLTQESLKELVKNKQAARFAEPFIEVPPEVKQKARQREIPIKPVETRVERPAERVSLFAAMTTPAGLLILITLFLANLYAGYEIAVYRSQSAAMVCAVSVFLPVVGPLVFLALPSRSEGGTEAEAYDPGSESVASPAAAAAESKGSLTSRMKAKLTSMLKPASGLALAAHQKRGEATSQTGPRSYNRNQVDFDRQFFEKELNNFFRLVPLEADKDLVLYVKSARTDYIAKRITRITGKEMHLQLQKGGAEVSVPFGEIVEVQVRNKDART